MDLQERLFENMKSAMRAGDTQRRDLLRLARAGVQREEKDKNRPLSEDEVVQVLFRQSRRHLESIEEFRLGGRVDLVEREEQELRILEEYLPTLLDRATVTEKARQVIVEVGASGPGDKGKVMGRLMAQLKGQADGAMVNEVVIEMLEA